MSDNTLSEILEVKENSVEVFRDDMLNLHDVVYETNEAPLRIEFRFIDDSYTITTIQSFPDTKIHYDLNTFFPSFKSAFDTVITELMSDAFDGHGLFFKLAGYKDLDIDKLCDPDCKEELTLLVSKALH